MIDLAQLYNLGLAYNIDIFSGITLPEGSPLELDVIKNTIMEKCGQNIPMYADPSVMASAITVWSAKNQYTFKHIAKILEAEYSPIENYDRFEQYTDLHDKNTNEGISGSSSKNENTKSSANSKITDDRYTTHSGTDRTQDERLTSADNASTYQPDNSGTSSITHGENIREQGNGTNKTDGSSDKNITGKNTTDRKVNEAEEVTHDAHLHGNIGVTTANQMQTEEYEFLRKYNPYNFIAGLFENELTLYVF